MPKEIENQTPENEETPKTDKNASAETSKEVEDQSDNSVDSQKIIDKLKSRLGKEQSQKNDALDQLDELKDEIKRLKQEKSDSKLSTEERNKKELSDKDNKIAQLEAEIRHRDAVAEVDGVFKDGGLNVGPKILDMVTTDNPDETYSNAQAIIDLINNVREDSRKSFLKGTTPKTSGAKAPVTGQSLNKMTLVEIARLKKTDPEAYREKAKELGWLR